MYSLINGMFGQIHLTHFDFVVKTKHLFVVLPLETTKQDHYLCLNVYDETYD